MNYFLMGMNPIITDLEKEFCGPSLALGILHMQTDR